MAEPRKSKLIAVRLGEATGKGNRRNVKRISKDATEKGPLVAVPIKSQDSIHFVNFAGGAASFPTTGSSTASQSPGSSVSRSKTALDDAYSSLESKDVKEEEQSASDVDVDDDSVGATSDLSFVYLDPDSDQDMKERSNLLKNLRNMPEWDRLSSTTTIPQSLAEEDSNMGVFRDTLDATSSIFPLEEASQQSEQDYDFFSEEEHKKASKIDIEALTTQISSESDQESNDEADNWKVERPRVEADFVPDITQMACDSLVMIYGDRQAMLLFSQTIQSYLYKLVDKVVERTERAANQLAKRLDKHKLHKQLCAIVKDASDEREKNDYLINRLTRYHLNHFRYSQITPDPSPAANESNYRRYQSALNALDSLLKKEQEAERIYLTERDRLTAELKEKQSQDEQEINRLEDLIRKALMPHTQMPERLESVVHTCLRQMRIKRNIISEIRLDLINRQHLDSYIVQKLAEKEIIADGLTWHTYETTIEEVNKLGRRLTIKTVELQRLYNMFTSKVHTISHMRCRRKLLSRTFRVAKNELCQLKKKLSDLRVKGHQGHMKHNRLLAQIQEVRYNGGLINYPLLLMDFDKTDKLVRDKRESVSLLRAHHDSLLRKIEEVEFAVQRSVSKSLKEDLIGDK